MVNPQIVPHPEDIKRDDDQSQSRAGAVARDVLRVPVPLYRHAAPSAPWPWMDFNRDVQVVEVKPHFPLVEDGPSKDSLGDSDESRWRRYPQSLFGNWTPEQVRRSRMFEVIRCDASEGSEVYRVDVYRGGTFDGGEEEEKRMCLVGEGMGDRFERFWESLGEKRPEGVRLRALFVERMSSPVMQMLGTRYNVEPFFFSSSANWIPSRYQEDPQPGKGDHITIVLPFVRMIMDEREPDAPTSNSYEGGMIDTQAPLHLGGNKILLQDLLAIHMVRTTTSDTIISYHPNSELRKGSAKLLQSLMQRTGDSVYWTKLLSKSKDPTLVLVAILWHAVYAWDESLEVLFDHLNKLLEATDEVAARSKHTRELHKVRAHLIYYWQLLRDFRKSVEFLKNTPNPAMDADSITDRERRSSARLLNVELDNISTEIERLDKQRANQMDRLMNSISLAFFTVKSDDTKARHKLTATTLRDSATMKQISYLTMVFLPPYFLAGIFRMYVYEMNPSATERLSHYVEGTVVFTFLMAWLVVALQSDSFLHPGGRHYMRRLAWPIFYVYGLLRPASSTAQLRRPPPRDYGR